MKPIHLFTTTLTLVAAAAPAAAQQPDTVQLSEIVVTATRVPMPRASVSAAVTVLDGADLRARGVDFVSEALRGVPGVTLSQTGSIGGLTSLFVRGGEADYVQVLIDGVPVNEPGGRFDFSTLTTDNIERIEVVRGPVSVLYGSSAVTGVVQIFTVRGAATPPRVSAAAQAGSYGTVDWDAAVSGGAGTGTYSFGLSRFATDGVLEFNNRYANLVASGAGSLRFGTGTELTLTGRHSDGDFHYPTDGAGNVVDRNAMQSTRRTSLGLEAAQRVGAATELRLTLDATELDSDIDDAQDAPADTLGLFAYERTQALSRRGADLRANLLLSQGLVLTLGAAADRQEESTSDAAESSFGPFSSEFTAERTNRAAYIQALAQPTSRISVSLGGRADDNEKFGDFFTYRAGASIRAAEGTTLRAAYGTAFKEPTFAENFSTTYTVGNPDLQPERSRSAEAGIEQRIAGDRVRIGATAFFQRFRDMIQYTFQPPEEGQPNYYNVAAARADGVELSAEMHALDALTLQAGYTFVDTEVDDAGFDSGPDAGFVEGDRLLRRPTHSGSIALSYTGIDRLTAGATAAILGSREDLDFAGWPAKRVELEGYTLLDLSASYDLIASRGARPDVAITTRIKNALDRQYEDAVHFPAPGRTILLGLRIGR